MNWVTVLRLKSHALQLLIFNIGLQCCTPSLMHCNFLSSTLGYSVEPRVPCITSSYRWHFSNLDPTLHTQLLEHAADKTILQSIREHTKQANFYSPVSIVSFHFRFHLINADFKSKRFGTYVQAFIPLELCIDLTIFPFHHYLQAFILSRPHCLAIFCYIRDHQLHAPATTQFSPSACRKSP